MPPSGDTFLPPHGNYEELLSFQKAEAIYDLTFRFAHKYLARGDRTIDQMVQSARSGKQNILEGSKASVTSKETEIKLTGVARASLEELLTDYRDFLRTRDAPEWDKNSPEAQYVRKLSAGRIAPPGGGNGTKGTSATNDGAPAPTSPKSQASHGPVTFGAFRQFFETRPPEVLANIAICLIHQTNYLLDRQIRQLEQAFLKEGGLRERMTRARLQQREKDRGGRRA